MSIKNIFDEIANESSTNLKMEILKKHKENDLLTRVLYLANSKRVKFFIKQILDYTPDDENPETLEWALDGLKPIMTREFTGHKALNWLQTIMSSISSDDAYIIERIIDKDCKIGMRTSNINKVVPALVEKTPYMGCVPFEAKKALKLFEKGATCISEIKADGRYCNVIIRGGEVELESRQGEPTFLGECNLIKELSKFDDCVLNGELVMRNTSRLVSNGIIASIIDYKQKFDSRSDNENNKKEVAFMVEKGMSINEALDLIQIKVWDIISVEDYYAAISNVKRIDRLNHLKRVISESENILLIEHKEVKNYKEAIAHFVEALERGEEGTVLKSLDGIWKNGKHPYQIKMKVEFDLDLRVIGFNYGGDGTKNENVISSVTCESSCGKLVARAQGIKEADMAWITENQEQLMGTIAKVKCNGLSSNSKGGNSLFYPTLKEFRDDKLEADSFEQCVLIDASAKGLILEIKK